MIFSFSRNNTTKLKEAAKKDYESAIEMAGEKTRIAKQHCLRVALRCRSNIDLLFIDAAKRIERHELETLAAIKEGKRPPPAPVASCYQLAKVTDGHIYTYLPEQHANVIFQIGEAYQTAKIDRNTAISRVQAVADQICEELGVLQSFQVLQFLLEDGGSDEPGGTLSDGTEE